MFRAILFLLLIAAAPVSAYAEENTTPAKVSENPYQDDITKTGNDLLQGLSQEETVALGNVRMGFGMIRAVRSVRDDVAHAVDMCGQKNPALKSDMDTRFTKWKEQVNPVLSKQEKGMESSLASGVFKDTQKIRSYLKLVDEAAAYADKQLDKQVITTEFACKSLMTSMDETQTKLPDLLEEIKWPMPEQKKE